MVFYLLSKKHRRKHLVLLLEIMKKLWKLEDAEKTKDIESIYKFPDGQEIIIGTEKFQCTEIFLSQN